MSATTILSDNGVTSGSAGVKTSGGTDGTLQLQTTTAGGTATTALSIDNSQVITFTNQPTYTGGTANGVAYLNGSKALTTGSALVFDGTNLGLGVTPSAWSSFTGLQVGPSGSVSNSGTGTPVSAFSNNAYYNGTSWVYINTAAAAQYQLSTSQHIWRYAASGSGNITWSEAMRLDTSGNLGIGTSSPGAKLEVNGNQIINFSGQSQSLITVGGGSTSAAMNLLGSSGSAYAWQISSNAFVGSALEFTRSTAVGGTTFSTPSMLLDSSGNLGLGVTPSAWATAKALQIGNRASLFSYNGTTTDVMNNGYFDGTNYVYLETATAAFHRMSTGRHQLYSAASGTAGATITWTNVLQVEKDYTLALQGGTSGAGTGISFPATQSASSDANTLDDYEEGTWTPSLRDGGNNRNPTYQFGPSGTYVKVGKLVFIRWGFKLLSKGTGTGSGEIQIYGLPFTPATTGSYQEENVSISTGILNTASNAPAARMVVNTSSFLFGRISNNADTPWTYNDLTDASWIIGEITYIATA